MTREDVQDFLAMVQAAYPNYNPLSKTVAVNVWTTALAEYSKDEIAMAFKIYMQTNTSGFAPAPGQLIDKLHSITQPNELNEMEAWALVSKVIRNSGYNSVEEYAKLPPLVQKAVGLPDQLRTWALDENYNEEVVMSQFCRCFRAEVARQRELCKMPSEVQRIAVETAKGSYATQLEDLRAKTINGMTERIEIEAKQIEENSGVPMPQKTKEKLEMILNPSGEK